MKLILSAFIALVVAQSWTSLATPHYVNLNNPTPVSPFTSWDTAATNIQNAVDVSVTGDLILVTNGIYRVGGKTVYGSMTNRVAITKAVTVQSVSGPELTVIEGYQVPASTNGYWAIRCAYLTNGAVLAGFTLRRGATHDGVDIQNLSGGGVWCESAGAVVTNCILTGNAAQQYGGGAYSGTLNNCSLIGNWAGSGGAASYCFLNNCTVKSNSTTGNGYGGGTYYGTLTNCTLTGNQAQAAGGGAYYAILQNCTLTLNLANTGGGAYAGTLYNCTLAGNWGVAAGGGAYGSTLNNCTLTNNLANAGGGVDTGTLNNCVLAGNSANMGGGAGGATLNNCTLIRNSADARGGGADSGTLNNCTLMGNSSGYGGGAYYGALNNCIVYYNNARLSGPNYCFSTVNYSCTTPLPAGGTGNIAMEPGLATLSHLSAASSCRGAGKAAYALGTDIDGERWANPPAIGCDEYYGSSITGALSVAIEAEYTNVAAGSSVDFRANIEGRASSSQWEFEDGTVISNRPFMTHSWAEAGDHAVVLRACNESNAGGLSATSIVHVVTQPIHFVRLDSSGSVWPYSSWATAATNIQQAVDGASVPGALVLVSNGIYATGGRPVFRSMTNRVAVDKPLLVQSLNGPEVTVIAGYQVPGATNGDGAVRCAYLGKSAVLSGFILTHGATHISGDSDPEQCGGGVWCSFGAVLTNCTLTGNSASFYGGGVSGGTLNNCMISSNSASSQAGGGVQGGVLNNCSLTGNWASGSGGGGLYGTLSNCTITGNSAKSGAGASSCTLLNCTVAGNIASQTGGGASGGILNNCSLMGNFAGSNGGGAYISTLNNCTVAGNSAQSGGGVYSSTNSNCIIYFNTAPSGSNYYSGSLNYCCSTPSPPGLGNFTNAPLFVDLAGGNLRLQSNSPCINAGNNVYAPPGPDLDGNRRIASVTVDIGAYEFQNPTSVISYAWLQRYGLPTDGSADFTDPDGDGMNDWREWLAGTNPTNAASVLLLLAPMVGASNVTLTWTSVTNRFYVVQRNTNRLNPATFYPIQSNIPGLEGMTTFTDTNAPVPSPVYYRVGVSP